MRSIKCLFFLMVLFALCVGCNETSNQNSEYTDMRKVHNTKAVDQTFSQEIKDKVLEMEEVTDVRAVNTENECIVAFKVKQFERFQIDGIEKKINKQLKKQHPKVKPGASSDQKIFLELEKLEKQIQENKVTKEELAKEVKKIRSLAMEKT